MIWSSTGEIQFLGLFQGTSLPLNTFDATGRKAIHQKAKITELLKFPSPLQ